MDRIESIRVFTEVAKLESFSKAAQKLDYSAPSVTRAVSELERALGVKLLSRTTRTVKLTELGKRYFEDVQAVLVDLTLAENRIKGIHENPEGVLTITAPILFGKKFIAPIIEQYLTKYRSVDVRALFYDRVTSMIEEEMDVAIRIGHLKDSSLYATQVGTVKRLICASPGYFEEHGKPQKPEDLTSHSIIFAATFESNSSWNFESKGRIKTVSLNPRLRCNQNDMAREAAINGLGITRLMSYQVAEAIEQGTLETCLDEFSGEDLPINILHVEGRKSSAKVRSFVELVKTVLKANQSLGGEVIKKRI